MDALLTFLNQGWVGTLIGFIFTVIGVYSYKFSKSQGRPVLYKASALLIDKDDPEHGGDVEIRFKGEPIERLTKSIFTLWNDGTETIRREDVVESDKIRFVVSAGERILSAKILSVTREVNGASMILNMDHENLAILDFEFFDPNDGVTVEILHTDEKLFPVLMGTIKGIPRGIKEKGGVTNIVESSDTPILVWMRKHNRRLSHSIFIGGAALSTIFVIFPSPISNIIMSIFPAFAFEQERLFRTALLINFLRVIGGAFGLSIAFFAALNLWETRKKCPEALDHPYYRDS